MATDGTSGSDCSRLSPCSTVARALAVVPGRKYVVIASGVYSSSAAVAPVDERWFIGAGPNVTIQRSTEGPILYARGPVAIHVANVTLSNATGTSGGSNDGNAIRCEAAQGSPNVSLDRVILRDNARAGLSGMSCNVTARHSQFLENAGHGVVLTDSAATVDGCVARDNTGAGMSMDLGMYTVLNTLVARNGASGIVLTAGTSTQRFDFNTIVDNVGNDGIDAGFNCDAYIPLNVSNNIIARNIKQTRGSCTFADSVIVDSDISGLAFKSPDVEPYDYHLTAGSIAIDAAGDSTLDHDIDGDARPQGAARDVGADEYVP